MQRCTGCGTTGIAAGLSACPHCGAAALTGGGSVLPSITVQCGNTECGSYGKQARIVLQQVAPGFLALPPSLVCRACGYVPETVAGWPYSPPEEENTMPKITRHGGASYAPAGHEAAEEAAEATPAAEEAAAPPTPPAEAASAATTEHEAVPGEPLPELPRSAYPEDAVDLEPTAESVEDEPERPSVRDPRSAWLAYAKAVGVDGADQMTKPQLIDAADFWAAERAANRADNEG
jgi:hypothetical protein